MRRFILTVTFLATILPVVGQSNLKLWYTSPANGWVNALPIGNGRCGAMIYGGGGHRHITTQ